MPLLDASLALVILGLVVAAFGFVAHLRGEEPEHKGERNLDQHLLAQARTCRVCGKPTIIDADILFLGAWFHPACFDTTNGVQINRNQGTSK